MTYNFVTVTKRSDQWPCKYVPLSVCHKPALYQNGNNLWMYFDAQCKFHKFTGRYCVLDSYSPAMDQPNFDRFHSTAPVFGLTLPSDAVLRLFGTRYQELSLK